MTIALGIDTGGTYTDAVLVDQSSAKILADAKALTTHHQLSLGVAEAVGAVFAGAQNQIDPGDVDMVSLSTTLATNALVEGHGRPVCLLLIGYDHELLERYGFYDELATPHVVHICGGHDYSGEAVAALDESAILDAVTFYRQTCDAFAVSAYFSIRNPEHELRARELIVAATEQEEGGPMPVTCGHELSSRLNSVRRATTTALNAQLIPLLTDLISTVRLTLDQYNVTAPLLVVKGDGSLVKAAWANQRPIETILSGPAASVVGAWHLAGRGDVWVVDMGGTTTDIAGLVDGQPRINPEGARVGRWQTMVEAVDVYTAGLGGDSHVQYDSKSADLTIGPTRVVPLCVLASHYPDIMDELRNQAADPQHYYYPGVFVRARRAQRSGLKPVENEILDKLLTGPVSYDVLIADSAYTGMLVKRVRNLASQHALLLSAFTPTDALHVLDRLQMWDGEAANLGAKILANRAKMTIKAFCEMVVRQVSEQVATALVNKVLVDEIGHPDWEAEPTAAAMLRHSFGQNTGWGLSCNLTLKHPLVAIGAPVSAYLPAAAALLNSDVHIPEYAGVANALGAVAGSVVQRLQVFIRPLEELEGGVRAYLPEAPVDFQTFEEAIAAASSTMQPYMVELARAAGAEQVEVTVDREDLIVPVQEDWGEELWLETVLAFKAVGRPAIARF